MHNESGEANYFPDQRTLTELDHDLGPGPHCEMNYHRIGERPPATHAIILTSCGHYDLMCRPCADATWARANSCRNPYVRCRECGDIRIGQVDQLMRFTALPGSPTGGLQGS